MLDRTIAPAINPIEQVAIPEAKKVILDNGLSLFYVRAGQQPVMRLEIIFMAGTWFEAQPGQSFFTAKMLTEGTESYSAKEIAALFDEFGAFVDVTPGFDRVTLDAVERVGLMGLVEDTDRHQEQTGIDRTVVIEIDLDVGLLEFDLTRLAFTCEGVFQFEFGEQAYLVVELVVEVEHEAVEVDLVATLVAEVVVMQFAVAADRHIVAAADIALHGFGHGFELCLEFVELGL